MVHFFQVIYVTREIFLVCLFVFLRTTTIFQECQFFFFWRGRENKIRKIKTLFTLFILFLRKTEKLFQFAIFLFLRWNAAAEKLCPIFFFTDEKFGATFVKILRLFRCWMSSNYTSFTRTTRSINSLIACPNYRSGKSTKILSLFRLSYNLLLFIVSVSFSKKNCWGKTN